MREGLHCFAGMSTSGYEQRLRKSLVEKVDGAVYTMTGDNKEGDSPVVSERDEEVVRRQQADESRSHH